jgi:hypothetical protein
MQKTLTFVHTMPMHIATFDQLLAEAAPDIPAHHIVDESLLNDARAQGLTPDITQRIEATMHNAFDQGAAVVLCTCSTIGGRAEAAGQPDMPVLRVDRAMAERAVALGSRIVLVAALRSTLEPTRALLNDAAQRAGKAISMVDVVCDAAWPRFEQGDHAGYIAEIVACLRNAADQGDVIVLAQASMAGAAALCADLPVPILSSPQLGLEAAVQAYRTLGQRNLV